MMDETLLTVSLPRWYVEQLSEEAERESLHYRAKVRGATPKAVPEWLERMERAKARWDVVESGLNAALDADDDLSLPGNMVVEARCTRCHEPLTDEARCASCGAAQ